MFSFVLSLSLSERVWSCGESESDERVKLDTDEVVNDLHYSSWIYPEDATEFQDFLTCKYNETMKLWGEDDDA